MHPRKWARDLIVLMVVLSVAIISPVAYFSAQAQRDISTQFISNAAERAVGDFRVMADSMAATLEMVRDWGDTGLFSFEDADTLNRMSFPIFDREKLLFGISVADMQSNSYYVRKNGEGVSTTLIDASKKPRQSVETLWINGDPSSDVEIADSEYDPRNRTWFTTALSAKGVVWTDPYKFYSSQKIGISASISFLRKKGQQPVVIGFDILLDELFAKMHKLAPSSNSRVFIFRRDAQLYIPKTEKGSSDFQAMASVDDSLIRKIHSIWIDQEGAGDEVISILHEGTTWWAGFLPLDVGRHSTWICVMVPEQDIAGPANRRSMILWLAGLGSILLALSLAYWIFRSYGLKLREEENSVLDSSDPANSICKLAQNGEGPKVEFKATMRMNLHAKRPGKEIELAWLKGVAAFLNTDGGTLLIGVADSGEITGLEQDVFENEDKCMLHFKNLIAQHIGAEFSKHIRFQIIPVGNNTVGVVSCNRSIEPVFLSNNKSEVFYIRNGPSSDELQISKALNYIKQRK
ncbi:MAG: putative DNA binding domain-containing protein [Desulfuromusa sp.]|nr:putative DNA binding domain-containing protein [Desulfuromusa sp.]